MVKKIIEYTDEGLLTLFSNAMNLIEKGQRVQEAEDVIKKIELEWEERLKKYLFADEKADRPSRGMLKTIGYAVGNDGVGTVRRQLLLDHLGQKFNRIVSFKRTRERFVAGLFSGICSVCWLYFGS